MTPVWIGPDEVRRLLRPDVARAAVADVLRGLRDGDAGSAERHFEGPAAMPLGVMVGFSAAHVGLKTITVVPGNRARGIPTIQGVVVLFEIDTGTPVAAMDGTTLTTIRTAAIAGYATDRLATTDAREMVMVGAGAQASDQVAAVLDVRPIERVKIWNRTRSHAERLVMALAVRYPDLTLEVADDLSAATRGADVISLATNSKEWLVDRSALASHCHLNAMGSFRPDHRELASDVIAAADVFVDTLAGCLEEAGDILTPIAEGRLSVEAVKPLWEADETSRARLTVLKSVGSASFDIACATRALNELQRTGAAGDGQAWAKSRAVHAGRP